jgi:Ca2+-transporting ATPase
MTMAFVVMGLGTVFNALTNRRSPASGLDPPLLHALAIALVPTALLVLATELPGLQSGLQTTSLTARQWIVCALLGLALGVVVEMAKWTQRRRMIALTIKDP